MGSKRKDLSPHHRHCIPGSTTPCISPQQTGLCLDPTMGFLAGVFAFRCLETPIATSIIQTTLRELLDAGIVIDGMKRLRLTTEKAQELYKMHQGLSAIKYGRDNTNKRYLMVFYLGKFFYGRLVRHISSGPVIAMRVRGNVRAVLGSSRLWPLSEGAVSLRQRFALSDVRNVAHASDAEAAPYELASFRTFAL
uniref:Nucleoside diphosphate kinase n=1 Tax=Heterorhabditis bacteriophora TaxID=37862 RepID=A0A1I7X2N5_HETBA